jgi:hypothetical protein
MRGAKASHYGRDQVVAEPRRADPLNITALPWEGESEHGLHDHERCQRSREGVWHLHLRYVRIPAIETCVKGS